MDDYWYKAIGFNHTILETFMISIKESTRFGRASMTLHSFFTAASFQPSITIRYFTQSLPIVLLIFSAGYYIAKNSDNELLFSFVSLISFSTFYDDGHHLIGAFPAALPIGLSLCFLYFNLDSFMSYQSHKFKILKVIIFSTPFFLYEIFVVLNSAYLFIRLVSLPSNGIKKYASEILAIAGFSVAYLFMKKFATIQYDGTELSIEFLAILHTFVVFATGFLPIPDNLFLKLSSVILILFLFFKKNYSKKSDQDARALVFFFVWLIPPFVISLTERYQKLALYESIYVTTYLSQVGFTGLCILLTRDLNNFWKKFSIFLLCILMFSFWKSHSSATLKNRYKEQELIKAKLSEIISLKKNCISRVELISTLPRFKHCSSKKTWQCDDIINGLASENRLKLCE